MANNILIYTERLLSKEFFDVLKNTAEKDSTASVIVGTNLEEKEHETPTKYPNNVKFKYGQKGRVQFYTEVKKEIDSKGIVILLHDDVIITDSFIKDVSDALKILRIAAVSVDYEDEANLKGVKTFGGLIANNNSKWKLKRVLENLPKYCMAMATSVFKSVALEDLGLRLQESVSLQVYATIKKQSFASALICSEQKLKIKKYSNNSEYDKFLASENAKELELMKTSPILKKCCGQK